MLLHSPPVVTGWLHLLTSVRHHSQLSGKTKELVVLRVGILNGAQYELEAHFPAALKEGMSQAQIDALPNWRQNSSLYDSQERAILEYIDYMTKEIRVPEETFSSVRKYFNERQMVELTAIIGAYNLVSRFIVALEIP